MSTHNPNDAHDPKDPESQESSGGFLSHHEQSNPQSKKAGFELSDANVTDVAGFLVVMVAFVAVIFVLAFGVGKLINNGLAKEDGPANKWHQQAGVKPGDMVSDPRIQQQQLQQLVKRFPEPRLQTDNGAMDVADMHAREDMLLKYYTWADEKNQTVRIPITLAMQLIAQKGLPVESQHATDEQHMFGDGSTVITAPLTDGFARTGPELKMIEARQQRLGIGPYAAERASTN